MKRSLVVRALLAVGVMLFVAGASTATTATAAKKHHHHKTTPPPPPSGAAVAVTGDLTETSGDGAVGFDFHGQGWFADEDIDLNAPGLVTACTAVLAFAGVDIVPAGTDLVAPPAEVVTDFSGTFNVALIGALCAPGSYQVEAQEVLSPSRVATTEVTITAPKVLATAVTLSPASEVESGTLGEIAGTVIIGGLNPDEAYTISSPALNLACSQPDGSFLFALEDFTANTGTGVLGTGLIVTTDFAGNDIVAFGADGCNAGSYPIDVTEDQAGFRSFDPEFTVQAP